MNCQKSKQSIVKILGIHRAFNYVEPYLVDEETQSGGTGFFVDPTIFGPKFKKKRNHRYILTNFHVVEDLTTNTCILKQPCLGHSAITAKVIYVVPKLDVAILQVDPFGEHPMFFEANLPDFLEAIPNLKMDEKSIKGNSQRVTAIGFPNLSSDYQICTGVISGRGMGMIQLNISFNGGNSGGPLFFKNKVIGICTASISDSEALGLAMPISQILHYFQKWTSFSQILLDTPSWGICYKPCTMDYLQSKKLEGMQGCLIKKTIEKLSIKKNDILMGIDSEQRYNIDNFGMVKVSWTDKRVPLTDLEFILSLNPKNIVFHYYSRKKVRKTQIVPKVHRLKTKKKYASWEPIEYVIMGGMVFMELCMNHLEEDEDEETYAGHQAVHLANFIADTMGLEPTVVMTHISPHSHVSTQQNIIPFDRIVKINNRKVKRLSDIQAETDFITIETQNDKHVFSSKALVRQEQRDMLKKIYPLQKMVLTKKRKFTVV